MKRIAKWLEENNFKFEKVTMTSGTQGLMVDTNYTGYYPKKETYQAHDLIKNKCSRFKGIKTEPRGSYTGLLITTINTIK